MKKNIYYLLLIILISLLCCNVSFAKEYRYYFDNATACDCGVDLEFVNGGSPTGLSVSCGYIPNTERDKDYLHNYLSVGIDFWTEEVTGISEDSIMRGYDRIAGDSCVENDRCSVLAKSIDEGGYVAISRSQGKKSKFNPDGDKKYSYSIEKKVVYDKYAIITIRGGWP